MGRSGDDSGGVRAIATTDATGPAEGRARDTLSLAALFAVVLGGAWGVSYAAGRLGLPVSRGLIAGGIWRGDSWALFPWADCAGMLTFMVALPLGWGAARGRRFRCALLGRPARTAAFCAAGLVLAAGVWAVRSHFAGSAYTGSLALLGVYWLVVAVSEEWAFRGVLQRGIAERFGPAAALCLATAVFVLWHGLPASGLALAVRLVAGLVLGLLYQSSGSLVAPIVCHWALNVALVA